MFVTWSLVYNLFVGVAYAAFTAVVLGAIGMTSAATKYNLYASLSNFPIWWLGLLLAWVAQDWSESQMLYTEAALGLAAVVLFVGLNRVVKQSRLPDESRAPAAAG